MRGRAPLPFLAAAALLCAAPAALAAVFPRDTLLGQCRWVHGRMGIYNGTFSYRIWVIGTHRMLRVVDDEGDNFNGIDVLPKALETALAGYREHVLSIPFVFADYRVCAFTRSRPGWMQSVTLTDARHIRIAQPTPRE